MFYHGLSIDDHLIADEEVLWIGRPIRDSGLSGGRVLFWALIIMGFFFVGYGFAQFFYDGLFFDVLESLRGEATRPESGGLIKTVFLKILAGLFFFAASRIPFLREEVEEKTIYAVTNMRAIILEDGEEITDQWGVGDIHKPNVNMVDRDKDIGNVWFTEEEEDLGDGDTGPRRPIVWNGFRRVRNPKEVKKALDALLGQSSKKRRLVNPLMRFALEIPAEWSLHKIAMPDDKRDNLLMAMLSAKVVDRTRAIPKANYQAPWSALVLSKRLDSQLKSEEGRITYLTLLAEFCHTPLVPITPDAFARYTWDKHTEIDDLVKGPPVLAETLRQALNVCQYEKLLAFGEKHEPPKVRINSHAKKVDLGGDQIAFAVENDISLFGHSLKIRQLYTYESQDWPERFKSKSLTLHQRFTLIATDRDKAKFYLENKNLLEEMAKSVVVHTSEGIPGELGIGEEREIVQEGGKAD
ncbi:MAG: hypothetical protein KDI06_17495 [Calditrichaeota bacterium]|nr:hypothetical protein [Calditrichota bacterium]HQU73083.1 hypothetical protein [Calditrichia bacterium]